MFLRRPGFLPLYLHGFRFLGCAICVVPILFDLCERTGILGKQALTCLSDPRMSRIAIPGGL